MVGNPQEEIADVVIAVKILGNRDYGYEDIIWVDVCILHRDLDRTMMCVFLILISGCRDLWLFGIMHVFVRSRLDDCGAL